MHFLLVALFQEIYLGAHPSAFATPLLGCCPQDFLAVLAVVVQTGKALLTLG
jgi:hypothetical protein